LQQSNIESAFKGNFKSNNFIFDLKTNFKNFFTNWIIVDSIDSLNGPSNWSLKKTALKNTQKIILLQDSQIVSSENSKPSSSILFRNKIIRENLYFKFVFLSKVAGEIFINFRYIDYENFLQLRLSRESKNKGKISLILNKTGKSKTFADLDCEKMVSFLKKCSGFEIEELNKIEVFSFKDNYIVLFNDMIIFTASMKEILKEKTSNISGNSDNDRNAKGFGAALNASENRIGYYELNLDDNNNSQNRLSWAAFRVQIGINNQKNFEIHDLQIKNLDLDDVRKFQSEISDVKNYAISKNYQILNASRDKEGKQK